MKQIIFAGFIIFLAFTGCDDKKVQVETEDADNSINDSDNGENDIDNYCDCPDQDNTEPDNNQNDPDIVEPDEIYYDPDVIPGDDTAEDVDFVEQDDSTDSDIMPDESAPDDDVTDCAVIGENVAVTPEAKECCEGLQKVGIMQITYLDHRGYCESLDGASVCINCGNSACEKGENVCNCAQDCAEKRNTMCDDGSTDECDMMPPVDCEGSMILAVQKSCWHCVDPTTCKESDRDAHCDDGTIPICNMIPPTCSKSEILAYKDGCYECVFPATCK